MRSSNAPFGVRSFFFSFYLTLDHCYLRLSLWIVVLTRFGAFRVQMALCWNLCDMGQVYLYYSPYFCLISIIVVAIVVPAQCYRVLIYVINL